MFSFLMKKSLVKSIAFAAVVLVLFLPSCGQPGGSDRLGEIAPSEDATLRSLTIDAGVLSPAFSASCFEYDVTVRNMFESINVTATPNSNKAVASGAGEKSLEIGDTTVTIEVTAESGARKTYTLNITRLDSSVKEIKTAQDMALLAASVNPNYLPARVQGFTLGGNYILVDDIILPNNFLTIGIDDVPFTGVFDGNGHKITLNSFSVTITDNRTYVGIFSNVKGTASAKAEIKNLNIVSSVNVASSTDSVQAVGLAVGVAEQAEISNITLSGTLTYTSAKSLAVGGVVGFIKEGVKVKNCVSSLDMNISPGNGGMLVSGQWNPFNYVGGIVGLFTGGAGVENCRTTGNVLGDNVSNSVGGQVFTGGIAGGSPFMSSALAYQGYILYCSSAGTINGRARGFWNGVGGIAGTLSGSADGTFAKTTRAERCFATGTVTSKGASVTGSNWSQIGGIVGYNYFGLVSQSYFTGTVSAEPNSSANNGMSGDHTGGISGFNGYMTAPSSAYAAGVEDCWSSGAVTGFSNAGGITGLIRMTNCYVKRSYSRAVVSVVNDTDARGMAGQEPGAGGIAGCNQGLMDGAVSDCVALNPSIKAGLGKDIHRVVGRIIGASVTDPSKVKMSNNYALLGSMPATGGTYTPMIGLDQPGGADIPAQYLSGGKPTQAFYRDVLGWDFTTVWKMGSDGYPKLQWQKE
jgi:hypothetical protein